MGAAQVQRLATHPVGKKTEVANLYEAWRQHVEQESAYELGRLESHDAAAVVVPGVAPPEADLTVLEAEKSSVGDGDPVGVAGQVFQHVLRPTEWRLGVDHPLYAPQA